MMKHKHLNYKVKVKLSLCLPKHHAMKTYWGSWGIAPHILDLGIRWRWVVSFTPRSFYSQGKSPWYPLDRRLGGPESCSGCSGEETNSQPPPGIEPLNPYHPACSPVLYWVITALTLELCITIKVPMIQRINTGYRSILCYGNEQRSSLLWYQGDTSVSNTLRLVLGK